MNKAAKKTVRPSLRRQLLLHLSGPLLLVLALGAAGGMAIARQVGYVVHDRWLLDSAMTLAAQVKVADGRVTLALPPAAIEMLEWDRVDRIYWSAASARNGRLLGNAALPAPPQPLQANQPQFYDVTYDGVHVRVVALEQSAPPGADDSVTILVAETMRKRDLMAGTILAQWAPLQTAVLLLAGAFIWLAVTRNLKKVDGIAASLGDYDADRLVPIADTDRMPVEIEPLTAAINRLIGKLSEEQALQKRFISNAAHQLRTPLATLKVQTQRVLREADPVKHDQALGDVHRAVGRLHHVTEQLLTLMRSEREGGKHLRQVPVDLADLARDAVERWTDSALARQIDLGYAGPEQGVLLTGEPQLLGELLGNLIDNAIRYSRPGGTVTVTLQDQPIRLSVEDDGPGIAAQERARVLERFYRGSNSDAATGCGLGLPIAVEIAARHGARLTIEPGPGGRGTTVVVAMANAV